MSLEDKLLTAAWYIIFGTAVIACVGYLYKLIGGFCG